MRESTLLCRESDVSSKSHQTTHAACARQASLVTTVCARGLARIWLRSIDHQKLILGTMQKLVDG